MKEIRRIEKAKPYLRLGGSTTRNEYKLFVCVKLKPNITAEFVEEMENGGPRIDLAVHSQTPRRFFKLTFKTGTPPENPMFFESKLIKPDKSKEKGVLVRCEGTKDVILTDPEEGGVGNYDDPDGDV